MSKAKAVFLVIISLLTSYSYSQSKWEIVEEELWKKMEKERLSLDEKYLKLQIDAGLIPNDLAGWYKRTSEILDSSDSGFALLFVNKGWNLADNGNVYREMQIRNDSSDSLKIERIDATIGGLQEFFFIDGEWKQHRKNGTSECGNSYYIQILAPHSFVEFDLSNGGLNAGEIEVKYKISITIDGVSYFSNIIKVNLHQNQYNRLRAIDRR